MAKSPEPLAGERKDNESSRAVQASNDYLRLGPNRSLNKLQQTYSKSRKNTVPTESIDTLSDWSRKFGWQERAAIYDTELERAKNEKRQQVLDQGLALDYERVTKLKRLARFLENQLYDEWAKNTDGETIDSIAYRGFENYKLWLSDVKQIGSGEDAQRIDIVRFNSSLISEYRAVLADLASETGGRKQKIEHTIKNLDYSKLNEEQLQRIANGEDELQVILSGYVSSNPG